MTAPQSTWAPDAAAERVQQLETALRELQHRAKNSLQLVISLLKLQAGRIRDPDARAAYDQTLLRIEALAILYRQLHESGSETHIDFSRYLDELCETTCSNLSEGTSDVEVTITAEPVSVGLYEAMPLGLIITELLSVSLRHAFPEKGWIRLTLNRFNEHRARLVVADNGRALPAGFDESIDSGMMLVEALAAQIGDGLAVTSDHAGTTVTVTFPI